MTDHNLPWPMFGKEVDGQVVHMDDPIEWMEANPTGTTRILRQTLIAGGKLILSTVFLGLNHRFMPEGPNLWYETMLFTPGSKMLDGPWRYTTRHEAIAGHKDILEAIIKEKKEQPHNYGDKP